MNEQPKNIGQLYKNSFEDFHSQDLVDGWPELEKKLNKTKFYRFGFFHFNIYYATLIALLVLMFGFVFSLQPEENRSAINTTKRSIETSHTESTSLDTNTEVTETSSQPEPNTSKTNSAISIAKPDSTTNRPIENKLVIDSIITKKVDSAIITPTPAVQTTAPVIKKKVAKKIIYVTSQDTLIVTDTIKTKNKRRLR